MDQYKEHITKAARAGDVSLLEGYLDLGCDPNSLSADDKKSSLLFEAAFVGKSLPCVLLLLARGADVNKQNANKDATALIGAAYNGDLEIAKALLEAGADKNIGSAQHSYQKPIDFAKSQSKSAMVELIKNYVHNPMPDCEQIVYNHKIADRSLQEIFNFKSLERVTFVRETTLGTVEAVLRDRFANLQDEPQLRIAFDEHVKRGGTRTEAEVFQIQRIRKLSAQP